MSCDVPTALDDFVFGDVEKSKVCPGWNVIKKTAANRLSRNPYNHFFTHDVQGLVDLGQFCLVARIKEPAADSLGHPEDTRQGRLAQALGCNSSVERRLGSDQGGRRNQVFVCLMFTRHGDFLVVGDI